MQTIAKVMLATLLTTVGMTAHAADAPEGCDVRLDLDERGSRDTPLAVEVSIGQSLCLDSAQIETWFIGEGGWSNELTGNHRYWRLTPSTASRTTLTLILPSGERQEVRLTARQASDA